MIDKAETRSVPIGLRVTPTLKNALDKAAEDDQRSVAGFIEKLVTDALRKAGYLRK